MGWGSELLLAMGDRQSVPPNSDQILTSDALLSAPSKQFGPQLITAKAWLHTMTRRGRGLSFCNSCH